MREGSAEFWGTNVWPTTISQEQSRPHVVANIVSMLLFHECLCSCCMGDDSVAIAYFASCCVCAPSQLLILYFVFVSAPSAAQTGVFVLHLLRQLLKLVYLKCIFLYFTHCAQRDCI